MRLLHAVAVVALSNLFALSAHATGIAEQALFVSGEGGYKTYRIPALLTTTTGALLAFCEGRKGGLSDAGDIDLLLRRSTDGGKSWGPVQIVVDQGNATCGNPCPMVDRTSGDVVLLITTNRGEDVEHKIQRGEAPARTPWVLRSSDDGLTWSAPRDISGTATRPTFRWYATGPGHGLQLESGRLIAPCDHSTGHEHDAQFSHALYSDDGGHTWAIGGILPARTNECIAVELHPGELWFNARNYFGKNQRVSAISTDGGLSFGPLTHEANLVDPICQASALSIGPGRVAFSNPASKKRENMTVRISGDHAKTWPHAIALWSGPSAYSDLALLPNGDLACLYERGIKHPYETITLAILPKRLLE